MNITFKRTQSEMIGSITRILTLSIIRSHSTLSKENVSGTLNKKLKGGIKTKLSRRSKDLLERTVNLNYNKSDSFGQIKHDLTVFSITLQVRLDSVIQHCEREHKDLVIPSALKTLSIARCVQDVVEYHNNLVIHNKLPFAFEFYNEVRNYCLQLLEAPMVKHPSIFTPRLSTGRLDRWPTAFASLRPLFYVVRDENKYLYTNVCDQLIRSILNVHRICTDYSEMSLDSITSKPKPIPEDFLKQFRGFVINKFQSESIKGSVKWETSLPTNESKSGPNGKMAFETAKLEAFLLRNLDSFNHCFKTLCRKTGNVSLYECMERAASSFFEEYEWSNNKDPKDIKSVLRILKLRNLTLRKLTSIPDSGHKSRVIAIVDYWFQIIYKGLEQDIVKILMKLYPDNCDIFDQSRGFSKLKQKINPDFKSYDCSNWTDRFRIELQEIVIKELYGEDIYKAWVNSAAKCKWKVKNTSHSVTYAAGQGMGTHGSFQIASLTSCLLMDFIYETHYKDKPSDFKIWSQVGDDMFCHDPDGVVLKVYELLDIPINLKKSKISSKENLLAEYISRNINHGQDVSRISARVCHSFGINLLNITSLYTHILERCEIFDWELFLQRIFLNPDTSKRRYKDHIIINLWKILIVFNYIYQDGCLLGISIKLDKVLRQANMFTIKEQSFLNYFEKSKEDSLVIMRLAVMERDLRRIFEEAVKIDKLFSEKIEDTFSNRTLDYLINKSRGKPDLVFPWDQIEFEKESLSPGKRFLICKGVNSFHKFQAELLGGRRKFNKIDGMNTSNHIKFLDNLEYFIKDTLISMIPKQLSEKKVNPIEHSLRMKISSCNGLLKYFLNDEEFETAVNTTFKYEILYLKGWVEDAQAKISEEKIRQEASTALRELAQDLKQKKEDIP